MSRRELFHMIRKALDNDIISRDEYRRLLRKHGFAREANNE